MSTFTCDACGKYKKPAISDFVVGAKVTFSQTKFSGNTVRMKAINGVIQEDFGSEVTVKYAGGNTVKTNKENLTMRDGPSPITLAMFGLCECAGGAV